MVRNGIPCAWSCLLTERSPFRTKLCYEVEIEVAICYFYWIFTIKVEPNPALLSQSKEITLWDLEFVTSPNAFIEKKNVVRITLWKM